MMSFFFAPNAEVGAKRFTMLSSSLESFGFEIHVLTIQKNCIPRRDSTLLGGGVVHRTGMIPRFPFQPRSVWGRIWRRVWEDYLCGLDSYTGWIPPAVRRGAEIIRKTGTRALLVSGPPFSPFVAAGLLQQMTGVRLVLDYRDPWATQEFVLGARYKSMFRRSANRMAERAVVRKASAVVTCSHTMKDLFRESFPSGRYPEPEVIHNGYWPEEQIEPLHLDQDRTVMIYAGELYGERRIELVAGPIRKLLDSGQIEPDSFRFYVFGRIDERDSGVLRSLGLSETICEVPRVVYSEMVRYLRGADILFLPSGAKVDYAIPFKFYDYLKARRPVLALTPRESELGRLMRTVDCGEVVELEDGPGVEAALGRMIRGERNYTFAGSEAYTWDSSARKYADLITRVLS